MVLLFPLHTWTQTVYKDFFFLLCRIRSLLKWNLFIFSLGNMINGWDSSLWIAEQEWEGWKNNNKIKFVSLLSRTSGSFGNISVVLEDFLPSALKDYSRTGAFLSVAHMTLAAPGRCSWPVCHTALLSHQTQDMCVSRDCVQRHSEYCTAEQMLWLRCYTVHVISVC